MVVFINIPNTPQLSDESDPNQVESIGFPLTTRSSIPDTFTEPPAERNQSYLGYKFRQKKKKNKIHGYPIDDIQSRRELLLQGKEGSRRRKRFENANFLNVPNSQHPLPSDWEVHPTYPVYQNVPYYLATLWDNKLQRIVEERSKCKSPPSNNGRVSQELKLALKKAKGARPLLQDLENEMRNFIQETKGDRDATISSWTHREIDSDDEEIVFIGKDKDGRIVTMSDEIDEEMNQKPRTQKLIFESRPHVDSAGGGFMRWLVHELAEYYGLESKSESKEIPNGSGHRYIRNIMVSFRNQGGIDNQKSKYLVSTTDGMFQLPRPLCSLV